MLAAVAAAVRARLAVVAERAALEPVPAPMVAGLGEETRVKVRARPGKAAMAPDTVTAAEVVMEAARELALAAGLETGRFPASR